jgi:tRNA-specific 2-thiouridylase
MAVRVEGDRVAAAGFEAGGCAAARAAGSAAVELVEGASVLEAARLTPDHIAEELGGLAPAGRHAAELAADALHRALGAAARDGAPALAHRYDRTLVAMSGGVDSAVAAQLAIDAGHEVVAVTLELWADRETDGTASCCSPQAVTGARALAHRMGLAHVTLDLRAPFREQVVDEYVAEHEAGLTPNPCVRCNGSVRFDAMLRLAEALGAGRLATGHYARIERTPGGSLLHAAVDSRKDQAYVLARLEPDELDRLWFPLGELEKPAVRELARAAALPVADRAESQDLCFLAGTRRERFLERHGRARRRTGGEIVDRAGTVLGRHSGQENFTIGQRRGLRVAAPTPLYVLEKDVDRERVVVGPAAALATARIGVRGARLHRGGREVDRVKLRYRAEPVACRIEERAVRGDHEQLTLALEQAITGAAPGQLACLMSGPLVIGSATIAECHPTVGAAAGAATGERA